MAEGFDISSGFVSIKCPEVDPGKQYIVVCKFNGVSLFQNSLTFLKKKYLAILATVAHSFQSESSKFIVDFAGLFLQLLGHILAVVKFSLGFDLILDTTAWQIHNDPLIVVHSRRSENFYE